MFYPVNLQKTTSPKEIIIHAGFIFLCLALLILFPIKGVFQELTKSVFFLIIIPMLYIKLVMKNNLSDFGLSATNPKKGIFWATIALSLNILIFFLLIRFTDFSANYKLPPYVSANFKMFLVYELVFANIILLVNEYFFRGFVLSALRKYFSYWAIPMEVFLFLILFAIIKNINWQIAPLIILGVTSSITAYKSQSIIYSYISSLLFLILLDTYIISTII